MAGLGGHMPDDDRLAVFGREEMLFGFAKARGQRRRSADRRNRKQDRALLEVQHGKAAEIEHRNDNQEPFQDGHVRTVLRSSQPAYIALTMFSVTFLASPSSIMVL